MNEKDLLNFLKNEGISSDFFEIVEEPEFSIKELKNFEFFYNLNTKDFLGKNNEELIKNYGLNKENILDWKLAYDNFNFYEGNANEINNIINSLESKEMYRNDTDSLDMILTSYANFMINKKEGDYSPSFFLFWASYQMIYF